jgi:RimJ/RimL family protein N-acetyltransferase
METPPNALPPVVLRPAAAADAPMILAWRNLPEIAKWGTTQRQITQEEHALWFQQAVEGVDRLLLIVTCGDRPIGQVHFDRTEARSCRVSIYLIPEFIGRGLGPIALKHACWDAFASFSVDRIEAFIHKDNQRSVAAFGKAGFVAPGQIPPDLPPGHVALSLQRPR